MGQPTVRSLQCQRERSTCTVTSLALDERSLVCALGTSGYIEVWDRRKLANVSSFRLKGSGTRLGFSEYISDKFSYKIWQLLELFWATFG